jgi:hypothetical protein
LDSACPTFQLGTETLVGKYVHAVGTDLIFQYNRKQTRQKQIETKINTSQVISNYNNISYLFICLCVFFFFFFYVAA